MLRRENRLLDVRFVAAASLAIAAACSGTQVRTEPSGLAPPSCADRDRAHSLCTGAVASQCVALRNECESRCATSSDVRLGPGSSEKEPAIRGDIAATRCRQSCDIATHECERPLLAQCPSPCVGAPGAAPSLADAGALQPDETADAN
jgi:hypothetical protein